MSPNPPTRIVGTPQLRKEGVDKVLGRAKYVDDLEREGMWHGATVRSSIPRGRITAIHYGEQIDWGEFVIVSAADIPGKNHIQMISADQPCLVETQVNHCDEAILLIAHPDKRRLPGAVASIRIDYEPMTPVLSIEESETRQHIVWGEDNIFKQFHLEKGNVDAAWASAAHIVEGEYRTGAQEHLYIENNGVIAEYSAEEGVTVRGSMQCPYYLHHALMLVFNLPEDKCRVIQTETGGAFGGKEDFPSVIGSHAALLAMKAGRPVKICYDRGEDMAGTTKRHPSRTRHRTAVSKDGKLLGCEIEVVIDGGAYVTLSPVVLSRATIHACGPYLWPNLRIRAKAMATNVPPHGAFRGFGAPQSLFALERHMDKIARVVGLTPEELRRRNFLKQGEETATGQVVKDTIDMQQLLTRALEESDYHARRERFRMENPTSVVKRGIGFAAFMHGSGFTGSGERRLNSLVQLEVNAEHKVVLKVSSTEFGQGTNTILSQVAAQTLRIPYEEVLTAEVDTRYVPNSGPTVASRTAMIVGKLVERASENLAAKLVDAGLLSESYTAKDFQRACETFRATRGKLEAEARYVQPDDIYWDDTSFRGEAYPAYAWAVYVAEVAVDTTTWFAECTNFWALQEVGKVLNPVLAKGQIEGGVAQGIGYALYEKCIWENGHMANNQMTNYIMPTSADLPTIHVLFEEVPCHHGAFGAKGIGELPMDGPGPAILNAIEAATGVAFCEIPLLPEDIFERLNGSLNATVGAQSELSEVAV